MLFIYYVLIYITPLKPNGNYMYHLHKQSVML
jgi:hypothetical protein